MWFIIIITVARGPVLYGIRCVTFLKGCSRKRTHELLLAGMAFRGGGGLHTPDLSSASAGFPSFCVSVWFLEPTLADEILPCF